jgi:hypothetical protein
VSDGVVGRLAVKTREQRFVHVLESDFEFSHPVAREVLATAQEILLAGDVGSGGPLQPGQVRRIIAAAQAPHGRPLADSQMVEIVWTLDAGLEDAEVQQKFGREALRQVRILRLIEEAADQGGLATEEDLAQVLQVTPRTIRRDVQALKARGELVSTRGKVKGVGRGQTHKVAIVAYYLQRHTYEDIQRRTRHSLTAIKRYISWFGRVALLRARGLPPAEIGFMLGISAGLVEQYLALLERSQGTEEQGVLADLLARLSGERKSGDAGKGGARA